MEKAHNLFLAGADYHAGYGNGYIEGAIRSGQGAADLIQIRLSNLSLSTTFSSSS
jgi:monoamine oxidase